MESAPISNQIQPAYEVRVRDENLRVQMQTQVLAAEPTSFREAVDAFRTSFKQRHRAACGPLGQIVELDDSETKLNASFSDALERQLDRLVSLHPPPDDLANYGWKVQVLPPGSRRILSIGCGGGSELISLRARFPDAEITALDYTMGIRGGKRALEILGVEFIQGNIFEKIKGIKDRGSRYDLIFSNHVIEHFYEPDEQIASLSCLLRPGGVFAAGLPLDGYPLADLLVKAAKAPRAIHPLDMNWLDVRHPWKTTESDMAATLSNAGLNDITIYRRVNHASRTLPLSLDGCKSREHLARRIYAFSLGPLVRTLKVLFGERPPTRLVRLIFAIDRRLWFGRYRMKVEVQPEVFVTAIRQN